MQVQITTTLPEAIVKQVESLAISSGKKKNQIFEESLTAYLLAEKRERYLESYKRAALDPEMIEMAEEGLKDYNEQFKLLGI